MTPIPEPVLYPNPVTGNSITLQLPGNNLAEVKVEIFTLAFREVKTVTMPQVPGDSLTITLVDKFGNSLANGLYYFRVSIGLQKWVLKVLVLR